MRKLSRLFVYMSNATGKPLLAVPIILKLFAHCFLFGVFGDCYTTCPLHKVFHDITFSGYTYQKNVLFFFEFESYKLVQSSPIFISSFTVVHTC